MQSVFPKIVRNRVPEDAAQRFPGLHPVLQRVFASRHLSSSEELDYELARLIPPDQLSQMGNAATLLETAIAENERILIVADFDADGATSCALAIRALKWMGAEHVDYIVPNRFEYGYGLTPEIVNEALHRNPDLIVTVDNGIASNAGVDVAKEAGVKVLITDHHLPGERMPSADAIVNPNSPGDQFESKSLAGVGVIFYIMLALRSRLRANEWFSNRRIDEPNMALLLDLVALGTVADVVPLDYNNRILVHQGIRRIRAGQCCEGIKALSKVAGQSIAAITSSDLGFRVGPRLNAAGRLDDMSLGIECLVTDKPERALQLAQQLDRLNAERREIEQSMKEEALADLKKLPLDQLTVSPGLCVYREEWHQGVIGILAARIRERFNRPVIAFAPGEREGEIKGSARSVPEIHIRDTLDLVAKQHPELLTKFGGHAMAAGLSLRLESLDAFKEAFSFAVEEQLDGRVIDAVVQSDGQLLAEEIGFELADQIRTLTPWGQHFLEPLFDGRFRVVNWREVGKGHAKMVLEQVDNPAQLDGIAFNQVDALKGMRECLINAIYRLDINEFRGARQVQLRIEHFEVSN